MSWFDLHIKEMIKYATKTWELPDTNSPLLLTPIIIKLSAGLGWSNFSHMKDKLVWNCRISTLKFVLITKMKQNKVVKQFIRLVCIFIFYLFSTDPARGQL